MRYEYRCTKCGKLFEIEKGIHEDRDNISCPKCGSDKTKRLFNAVNIGGTMSDKGSISKRASQCPSGTCPFVN